MHNPTSGQGRTLGEALDKDVARAIDEADHLPGYDSGCLPTSADQLHINNPQQWIDLCA